MKNTNHHMNFAKLQMNFGKLQMIIARFLEKYSRFYMNSYALQM